MDHQPDVKRHTPTRSVFHEAPEVAQPHDAPMLVHQESDGLQSAYPLDHKPAPYYSPHPVLAPEPQQARASRKWLWIVGAVVAALIGLGAGIGIGYAVGNGSSSDKASAITYVHLPSVSTRTHINLI